MNETIQKLINQRKEKMELVCKLDRAIKAFQDVCEHEWKWDGHDSHHDYGRCIHCDLVEEDVC